MSSIEQLEMQIAKQKAELKRLKEQKKIVKKTNISTKEANDFKKFCKLVDESPFRSYYKFLNEVKFSGEIQDEIRAYWWKKEDLERARQFIILINPDYNDDFLEAIDEAVA
jgi:hypothetical protein